MQDKIIQRNRWAQIVLIAVSVLVFCNIFPNQFIADDIDFIVNWPLIQRVELLPGFFSGVLPSGYSAETYAPVKTLIFFLLYQILGLHPLGYHLFSLAVHLCGVMAVYYLIYFLTDDKRTSFWGGLIVAVHPIHAVSIVSMTAAVDTAGIVLMLWSFYFYLRMFGHSAAGVLIRPPDHLISRQNARCYWLSVGLAAAAIFCNQIALSLPILIVFYAVLFSPERHDGRQVFKHAGPFAGLLFFYSAVNWAIVGNLPLVGALSDAADPAYMTIGWPLGIGLSAVVVVLVIFLYQRKFFVSAFCIGWFSISLLPVMAAMAVSSFYAQRHFYGISFPVFFLIAHVFSNGYRRLQVGYSWAAKITAAIFYFWVGVSCLQTFTQNTDYRDDIIYYERAVSARPKDVILKHALMGVYIEEGFFEKAIEAFEQVVLLDRRNPEIYFAIEPAYSALERYEEGAAVLKKAIELDPDFAEAYFNLAGMTTYLGDEKKGLEYFSEAIAAWRRKGMILEAGDAFEAFQIFLLERKGMLPDPDPRIFLEGLVHE